MKKNGGWGIVHQKIMRSPDISLEAKGIYAYLASIAGSECVCYPSIETMQKELNIGKNRLAKHLGQLISVGVVEKIRERSGNIYGHNVYKLVHKMKIAEVSNRISENCEAREVEAREVEAREVEAREVEARATNNNIVLENQHIKKKNRYTKPVKAYFPDDELLNQTFVDYLVMRKQIKKPATDKAIELAIKKLNDLAAIPFSDTMDSELAIQILNQSIMNSWQGLFPLKEQKEMREGNNVEKRNQGRGQASDYFKRFIWSGESNQD